MIIAFVMLALVTFWALMLHFFPITVMWYVMILVGLGFFTAIYYDGRRFAKFILR